MQPAASTGGIAPARPAIKIILQPVLQAVFGNADALSAVQEQLGDGRDWAAPLGGGNPHPLIAALKPLIVAQIPDKDWVIADVEDAVNTSVLEVCGDLHLLAPVAEGGGAGAKRRSSSGVNTDDPNAKKPATDPMECVRASSWYSEQCTGVREWVAAGELRHRGIQQHAHTLYSTTGQRSELWLKCTCGAENFRADAFANHVLKAHGTEFVARCGKAEVVAASQALSCASAMLAEVQERSISMEQAAADAESVNTLHEQLASLQSKFKAMQTELAEERSAATYFESKLVGAQRTVEQLVAERESRGWRKLCATAELHQALHEGGAFDDPRNRTLDELHWLALQRVELGKAGARRGGQRMHLSATARALAFALYNKCPSPAYRLLREVFLWLPRRKKIARAADQAFATTGCSEPEWGQQAARIFSAAGYDPKVQPFGLCFDAVKVTSRLTWNQRLGKWVGQVDFNSRLSFNSWEDMQQFLATKVAAGYALFFLLCPLSPVIPSIVVPVGILPTDLRYTSNDLGRWTGEIFAGLSDAGFGRVLPTAAGDNAGPHGRYFKLCGNLRGSGRESGGSIGHELLESAEHEPIFSLGAFRREGASCETAATTDPTHNAKNGSLQPYHLSCFLQLGNYALLAMMFVNVRAKAGLHATDVNNADPMDVPAAERRLNVATRRELAKRPECFGMLVYLWAIASARAAFLDRAPSTTPYTRVRWALRCLIVLRWWLDWIEVSGSPSTSFISMETHAAHVIQCQMLVMIVLIWGRDFSDKQFAPWLIGSDQCEHFFSELRAYRRAGMSEFTLAECVQIVQRYISSLELFNHDGVQLPPIFSNKGYSCSTWTPSPKGEYIFADWPSVADIRTMYLEEVAVVRPLMVALGCAPALREAGRWHSPSLEEWKAIEAALDQEERQQAQRSAPTPAARRRRPADKSDESDEDDDSDNGGGSSDDEGGPEEKLDNEADGEDEAVYYPERILDHRLGKGPAAMRVAGREFLIQWRGWGTGWQDVTWEKQSELIQDGNATLVHNYLLANPTLKRPDGLDEAVAAEGGAVGVGGGEEGSSNNNRGEAAMPPRQPAILQVNMEASLSLLTAQIGAETPNGTSFGAHLKEGASTAQRKAFEATRIKHPETGELVHKSAALAFAQRLAVDGTPGAGRGRYARSTRQPVIAEDRDGSGFACGEHYELHVNTKGAGLNSGSGELQLEGELHVGYACVMELRKLNGKGRVLRHSIRAADASVTLAVLLPLVKHDGNTRWGADFAAAPPVLVPVLSLGRRVEATSAAGGMLTITVAAAAAGGPELRRMVLSQELFSATAMKTVSKDLLDLKVTELKDELAAWDESTNGNKAFLRRRLHAAIVRLNMRSDDEDE